MRVDNRVVAIEQRTVPQVESLTRLVELATAKGEVVALRWMRVPTVIGVVIVIIGIVLLGYAFFGAENQDRFNTVLWGGVALIAIGALSATAAALVAKPISDEAKLPTLQWLGGGR